MRIRRALAPILLALALCLSHVTSLADENTPEEDEAIREVFEYLEKENKSFLYRFDENRAHPMQFGEELGHTIEEVNATIYFMLLLEEFYSALLSKSSWDRDKFEAHVVSLRPGPAPIRNFLSAACFSLIINRKLSRTDVAIVALAWNEAEKEFSKIVGTDRIVCEWPEQSP